MSYCRRSLTDLSAFETRQIGVLLGGGDVRLLRGPENVSEHAHDAVLLVEELPDAHELAEAERALHELAALLGIGGENAEPVGGDGEAFWPCGDADPRPRNRSTRSQNP